MRIGSGPIDLANVGKGHIISLDAHYTGTDMALAALASETAGNSEKFVYAIPEARIKPLLVKPAELHEAKPAPPPQTASDTATASAELQQVEATHILIAWQGADRSSATRSKEEARKLIDELHEKIKKGADIGELAKEHSDCPSGKSSNGSLGSFGRGMMAKPFEDAAFGLEVGKVSSVVETGFGYHLIRRDK
jgi:parvulin-like peptidyl-prolyl isomerase